MLIGFVLLGLVPVMVRAAKLVGWGPAQTVCARFLVALLCILLLATLGRQRLAPKNRRLLLLRGVLGGVAVLLFFSSVQLTGAGIGTLLNYTYPIWANLFAVLFWRKRPKPTFWLLLASAMLGIFLVIRPDFNGVRLGEAFGALSGVVAGAAVLCIKRLRETDRSLTIIFSFSLVGLIAAAPIALLESIALPPPFENTTGWLLLLGTGLFSFFGHVYFTRGFKDTSVQLGSVLALSVPVVATLTGWLFLDEPLTWSYLLGAVLVLAASALLSRQERQIAVRRSVPGDLG